MKTTNLNSILGMSFALSALADAWKSIHNWNMKFRHGTQAKRFRTPYSNFKKTYSVVESYPDGTALFRCKQFPNQLIERRYITREEKSQREFDKRQEA